MLLSLNWLKDYLLKPEIKIDPKVLSEQLTMRGLHVSAIRRTGMGLENVVVGRIEKIEPHPNADRLQITYVVTSAGEGATQHRIVCGAKNIAEGDVVPVALPGAVLPGDVRIKVSRIRDVESSGMICSGRELGIAEDSEGILQLPKQSALGQPIGRLFGQDDTLLEFELTPNRPDCLSVLGLVREICPILNTKPREPKPSKFRSSSHRTSSIIKVEVDDLVACPRYLGWVIDAIKVTESPDWIRQRLQSVGIRPVNNIVDITNFVMMEYGQPLHAFDLRKIETGTIRVATCKAPTQFVLLSDQTVELQEGDILVQDGDRPIALAGIMGGANSQIMPDTTSILLESAVFSAPQIRKTARRLGLHSESSKRFERGVDILNAAVASERAAALLRDSFNANVYYPPIDTNEIQSNDRVIALNMRDVRKVTGIKDITSEQVTDQLASIAIPSHKRSANVIAVKVPSFRLDLCESVDLIEEVARLVGYDAIPENYPTSSSTFDKGNDRTFDFEQNTKMILRSLGLRETIHYSFLSETLLAQFGAPVENLVVIQNPINEDMKVMRTSLLPSLLMTYKNNTNRRVFNQRLFELSKVYSEDSSEENRVKETTYVSGVISGSLIPPHWKHSHGEVDFFYVKGLVESFIRQLTSVSLGYEQLRNHKLFHPHRSALLKLGLKEVGLLGEIHSVVRENLLDTVEPVVAFEIHLDILRRYERSSIKYKTSSKYPSVNVDIAVVLDKTLSSHSVVESIRHSGGSLLNNVEIFDVYEGEHIPEGKKSLAFHLNFLSSERTLLDQEVNNLKDRIVIGLKDKFGAILRS